ncbi:MAG: dTDP-4-dehydrorhamnose reductase [Elusimicrobia bacterium]|nr:dTDP-4-dehydrorhamnose reductase [Candidatus Liberimonas magnetica]
MKVLIVGINGMLGKELTNVLAKKHEVIGIDSNPAASIPGIDIQKADICDQKSIYEKITKINPDIVILTAALTDVDLCETEQDLAYKVNALGPRNVALACQRFDTQMLYISTDYVFPGDNKKDKEGYKEFDKTGPVSYYGKSKLYGEWFVKNLLNKFYIVRTAWLFGKDRMNFIDGNAQALQKGQKIRSCTDMIGCPTNVLDLSIAIEQLIESGLYGIYHVTNSGFASRYEISVKIADIIGSQKSLIEKVIQKDLKLKALRPEFCPLIGYNWKMSGFKPLRSWQDSVEDYLRKYLNSSNPN